MAEATFWERMTVLTECSRAVCDEYDRGTLDPILVRGLRESVQDIYAASWTTSNGTTYRLSALDAAAHAIRAADDCGEYVRIPAGEWSLFVDAWNRIHDRINEARQGDDFVRLHETRMAAA